MLPELPDLPEWPKLNWIYRDGYYCLSESDVDQILDYCENSLPLYRFQIDLYKKELGVIISHL